MTLPSSIQSKNTNATRLIALNYAFPFFKQQKAPAPLKIQGRQAVRVIRGRGRTGQARQDSQ